MGKPGYVYILTNSRKTVLYTGVTSDLRRRLYQHKHKLIKGFTHQYNCDRLVWFEKADEISTAIMREKQIKAGSRGKKEALINVTNPGWKDLSENWF